MAQRQLLLYVLIFMSGLAYSPCLMSAEPAAVPAVIDNFENNDWEVLTIEGTTATVKTVDGKDGKAISIEYDLANSDKWVQINKKFYIELPEAFTVKMFVRARGKANNLEFKLVDADESNFGYKFIPETNGEWEEVQIESRDITYWWGGDEVMGKLDKIFIAISVGEGGAGTVDIDRLELIPKPALKPIPSLTDDMKDVSEWSSKADKGTKIEIKQTAGLNGKAMYVSYNLGDFGEWVSVEKDYKLDGRVDSIGFLIKSSGSSNAMEIQLTDADGSVFVGRYEMLEEDWDDKTIAAKDLKYAGGGDSTLNGIEKLTFKVLSIGGGKGRLYIDEIIINGK